MTLSGNVRLAGPGDEQTLRRLRLMAMTDAPEAFGSTYEREAARTPSDWTQWLSSCATFFSENPDGEATGLAAGKPDAAEAGVVHLMAMWVAPKARGTGAAGQLIDAVIAWAAARGSSTVRLCVDKDNARARRAYERHGFFLTGNAALGARPGRGDLEMERAAKKS